MGERLSIPEDALRACLHDQYGLAVPAIDLLHRAWDSLVVGYRVVSARGTSYLLRARFGSFYEPSCRVPHYLRIQGITAVVAPIPTSGGALWTAIQGGKRAGCIVALFPYIEGETGWRPRMTDEQWHEVGVILAAIHKLPLPSASMPSLRQETFDPGIYIRQVERLDTHFDRLPTQPDTRKQAERTLRERWRQRRSTISTMLAAMQTLAQVLRRQAGPLVICHADLHPGNIIRDRVGHVHVIDWDDVMLAPKERDFLFVECAPAENAAHAGVSPFFQGYGSAKIDWVALAYYRFERVIQDLIEHADEVVFRDDVDEDARADAVRLFEDHFVSGDTLDAAWAAAAQLPPALNIRPHTEA